MGMQEKLGTEICEARWEMAEADETLMEINHQSPNKTFHKFEYSSSFPFLDIYIVSCLFDM
jgi:hypothetical protein